MIQLYGHLDPKELLERGGAASFRKASDEVVANGGQ